MIPVTLYKRDARGNILRWQINQLADGTISIAHGIYAHKPHVEFINPTMKKANEVQSRINAKRKEGYKAIEDLWDNAPKELDSANTYEYLRLYLPKYNTTYKCKKDRKTGDILDEYWLVLVTKEHEVE